MEKFCHNIFFNKEKITIIEIQEGSVVFNILIINNTRIISDHRLSYKHHRWLSSQLNVIVIPAWERL
ncbi:MAG: hypothetical protein ABIS01_03515, partial [Ferruginibacter sp.]